MKIFKITFGSFLLLSTLSIASLHAQASKKDRCATMPMYEKHMQLKWRKKSLSTFETWMAQKVAQQTTKRTQTEVYEIPIIVHIVHPGDEPGQDNNISREQVISQLIVLNQDFRRTNPDSSNTPSTFSGVAADTKIQFKLAVLDTNGKALKEAGIHRYEDRSRANWTTSEIETILKPATSWDPKKYLNIWVVPFSNSNDLGYAQFPEQSGLQGITIDSTDKPETDGVTINTLFFGSNHTSVGSGFKLATNFDRGRTVTHEVGHWLGLRHIWGDGGCSQDDFCADTPSAGLDHDGLGDCTFPGPNTCPGDSFDDMFQNYMDYTNDICMNLFTNDQKTRMRTVLQNSPRRKEVIANAHLVLSAGQSQLLASSSKLFPNPAGSSTLLNMQNQLQGAVEVVIADLAGKVIQKNVTQKTGTNLNYRLNTKDLPQGVYIISIKMAQGTISKRLVRK